MKIKIGKTEIEFASTQTRGVLAGAYKAGGADRTLLTHLVFEDDKGYDIRSGCRMDPDSLVDPYGAEDINARPTCPICARKWDQIKA